ncbi:interphotoreceptor retinoid-binding protein [Chondromyces apiculatus DSM 436]|uniref:Interphotoreceptor retinoid-binding protein n=2 Tax=Chondromyces apiculatus TaxID=51 RepID=A0A017TFM2_9BACT|nr:interphotoreceptor retinoid-binding protein [Chondromyces apiculatus DSM 436]
MKRACHAVVLFSLGVLSACHAGTQEPPENVSSFMALQRALDPRGPMPRAQVEEAAANAPPVMEPQVKREAPTEAPRRRPPDGPITTEERGKALERLSAVLKEKYVFPDRAQKVATALRTRRAGHAYDTLDTGHAFADAVTAHVDEVLHDGHFRVVYRAEGTREDEHRGEPTAAERARHEEEGKHLNGGFERVERLPGNIGYIAVRSFAFPGRGAQAVAAAMELVAETEALILDIRGNRGGDPDTVAALCSYFFAEPVHLNDIYDRTKNETRQYWTSAGVTGRRYLNRDVYVLTSRQSYSAAEEFAYDLQQLKRATLVGETTGGAANPGERVRLSEHLLAFVPTGRPINPVSKTNWEGTGVKPDIAVAADDALRVAQVEALKKLLARESSPERRGELEERLQALASP